MKQPPDSSDNDPDDDPPPVEHIYSNIEFEQDFEVRGSQCGSRLVAHSCCQQRPTYQQPNLLPIAVGAMGVVCPECKVLYQLSQGVGKYNSSAGAAIATLAFVIFGIVALEKLAGKKRR